MNHSRLSAHVLHIPTLFILCSSFYLQTYTDIQSSRVTSLCYISEFLKHILALLGCFDILHLYFVEQLTKISPFAMPSSICKCDKPLEPLSTCATYSNSFYPLQLFLPFHMYPNLPIH